MRSAFPMTQSFELAFSDDRVAKAVLLTDSFPVENVLEALEIPLAHPVLVIVGGASKLCEKDYARLQSFFLQVIAPLAESLNMRVIDGGTDAGVMQLIGKARKAINASFPLIGVAPIGLMNFPGNPCDLSADAALPEPNHTHFVLIPGAQWGDESPWIAQIATTLAAGQPSIAILANGGEITWRDAQQNIAADRPVIVIEGSGRTADVLAEALHGNVSDERAKPLVDSQLLQAIEMADEFAEIEQVLRAIFEKAR